MRFEAEVVATGDELMTGAILDTNTGHAARRLRERGVLLRRATSVGDAQAEIEAALREAAARADVVVVSGGLGPTEDDRSAAAAAAVAGVPLVRDAQALAAIETIFHKLGREMTPNNGKQADLPQGCEVLPNPVGTAPGFAVRLGRATGYFLPGVPHEFTTMLDEQVLPRIDRARAAAGATTAFATRAVRTCGLGESKVETELAGIVWPAEITVGFRASIPEVHVRLYAAGESSRLGPALDAAESAIRQRLGVRVFGLDDETLPSVLGGLLEAKGIRLAVAESCTGGLLGRLLTDSPGASRWFDRGWITYSDDSKREMLGVDARTLAEHGAVSEACAREMAAGALDRSGAGLALSITGIAGPSGGTPTKPVGTVWIACASDEGVETRGLRLGGDRERIRVGSAYAAIDLARRLLLGVRS